LKEEKAQITLPFQKQFHLTITYSFIPSSIYFYVYQPVTQASA